MAGNRVVVSDDGMELTIRSERGQQATLRSARPGGFTEEDIENARSFTLNSQMVDGQVNRARRLRIGGGRKVYVHINTGPPTWWRPRAEFRRGKIMVGWLRVLIAVSYAASDV
jgi:hypothetical protein